MKTILILTYYWPPAGGPGVQRWLKFAKYLKELGWDPVILTVEKGTYSAVDEALLDEVPQGLRVYKTRSRDPFRYYNMLKGKKDNSVSVALINIHKDRSLVDRLSMYIRSNFFIPDARRGWVSYAFNKAMQIISEGGVDLVVTTGPPHSTHLAGLRLKKKLNIKWLADLRDPWTTVYYNDMLPRTSRTKRIDKHYEDEVLRNADAVSVVSPGMQKEFSDRNLHVEVVMNGFDLSDMPDGTAVERISSKFRLTYTGNFNPNQHIPEIWDAICELIEENEEFRRDFRLRFVGNLDTSVPDYLSARGCKNNLEVVGYVPHAEVTHEMVSSGVLLFVVPQSRNNRLIITGKLFEYMASGSAILSVGPTDGDAARIIKDTGREPMLEYGDKEGFRSVLLSLYHTWQEHKGAMPRLNTAMLDKYSRKASAEKISGIMNEIIKTR
ncbi:MAG: glycosyltransferase family 4 protein [Bacteroidales bacterium]|nr:glycosyltransferase family 4 protein [Bacteroidales bacterium]